MLGSNLNQIWWRSEENETKIVQQQMMEHNKFVQFDFHWINQLPLLSRRLPLLSRKGKLSGIWRQESQKVASSEQLGGQLVALLSKDVQQTIFCLYGKGLRTRAVGADFLKG